MKFGPYTILDNLGRGAMGMVYHAVQDEGSREVALKILKAKRAVSSEAIESFRNEAKIAAGLKHPNIVPIHTFGQIEGKHYYTMDFVDGDALTRLVDDDALTPDDAARIAAALADALSYAHRKGVVHSDLKPANILIDGSGQPLITDFGLARRVQGGGQTDTIVEGFGTPAYMAPEQSSGQGQLTFQTDIFALGAVLYEMLTGRPPYEGKTANDTMMLAAKGSPPPPSSLNPYISQDLEALILKAMAKNPEDRYPNAEEMRDDLNRFLRGDRVAARKQSPLTDLADRFLGGSATIGIAFIVCAILPFLFVFVLRLLNAPDSKALANKRATELYLAAAKTYLKREARLEAERIFSQTEREALEGPARNVIVQERLPFDDNRRVLVTRFLDKGERALDAADLDRAQATLAHLEKIPFTDAVLRERFVEFKKGLAQSRGRIEADEETWKKTQKMLAGAAEQDLIVRAYRAYLTGYPTGIHSKHAQEALGKVFPLYLPNVDITPSGKTFVNNRDGAPLVYVRPGGFVMGSNRDAHSRPVHRVVLSGFYMYRHEITNSQYVAFLNDVGRAEDQEGHRYVKFSSNDDLRKKGDTWTCDPADAKKPIAFVTWFGAAAYATWAGAALPTEAQWEKASRGEDGRIYPWGDGWDRLHLNSLSHWAGEDLLDVLWADKFSEAKRRKIISDATSTDVGSFPTGASPFGCLNMAGNMREWCRDTFDSKYYKDPSRPKVDPVSNLDTGYYSQRGGSYLSFAGLCQLSQRRGRVPSGSSLDVGFRCVLVKTK